MHVSFPHVGDTDIRGTVSDFVLRACNMAAQLPSPRSRMEAYLKVNTAIRNLRQQLFSALNEVALINQLPDAVLKRIFCQLPPLDLLFAMFTCRRWCFLADQAFFSPSRIRLYGNSYLKQQIPGVLALTQHVPLSLDISVYHSFEELGVFLQEQMYRTRKLRVRVFFDFDELDTEPLVRPIVYALQEAAPQLQVLDVYIARGPRPRPVEIYLPDPLFANSAPLLRSVKLDGITTRLRAYDAFSVVRVLDLCQPEVHLVRILDFYPRLEHLRVSAESLVSGRRKINPHNLRLLDLPGTVAAAEIILKRLVLTRPLAVWMVDVGDDTVTYILSNAPRSKLRRVRFCLAYEKMHHGLILGYSTGVTWFLGLQKTSHARGFVLSHEETMCNIVDLSIHEVQWPAYDNTGSPAARLSRLELVLDAFDGDDSYSVLHVHDNAALFYSGSPFALRCPALNEICLSAPVKIGVLTVDVYDVCAFISGNLSFDSRPHLALRNIQLYDPAFGRGMQMLTACVSEISYFPSWLHDVPYIHLDRLNMLWMYDLPSL